MPLVATEAVGSKSKADLLSGSSSTTSRISGRHKLIRRSHTLDGDSLSSPSISTSSTSRHSARPATHQSLDELVKCGICLAQLRRPTMLPCQHTFCLLCLQKCVHENSLVIVCPTCRLKVAVPSDGVSALPTNILLQAFLESLKTGDGAGTTARMPSSSKPVECLRCSSHQPTACQHCNELLCNSCHQAHKKELETTWSELIDDLFAEDQRLSLIKEESKARAKKLRDNVQATVAIRTQQLLEKQDHLLNELKTWRSKEKEQLAEIQQLCQDVLSLSPSIGSTPEHTPIPKEDVLKQAAAVLQQARQYGTSRLKFDTEELALIRESIEEGAAPATGTDASAPEAAPSPPGVRVHSHSESSIAHRDRRSSRRVTFTMSHAASTSLDVAGSPPTGRKGVPPESPSLADEQSLYYRSKSGNPRQRITSSLLQRPAGVAVSPWTGEIYVAVTDSHCVYVIDKHGKVVKKLGTSYRTNNESNAAGGAAAATSNGGTFLCPFGIAFSPVAEEIYVTDKWLNCIQVFNREGVYERQIGTKGASPGHFRSPEGIAVDLKGFIYVCDTCNDRVQVLDRHGAYVRELGTVSHMTLPGGKPYQKKEFSEPTGVAISPDGERIAVCDNGNCRIKVFNSNGELVTVFGFRGTQRGQFQDPECLVIDDKGFVVVGDNGNGRIQIFRPNGNFVRALGSKGSGPGQFNWISGLALSKDMEIIVADFKNHCIQIF